MYLNVFIAFLLFIILYIDFGVKYDVDIFWRSQGLDLNPEYLQ